MTDALSRYKALVDKLRELLPSNSEFEIDKIDDELKLVWTEMSEQEKSEAELYWRTFSVALSDDCKGRAN